MKAIRIHTFGGPDVLAYENAPEPQLQPGEVLVRNYAAGVNPIDWKTCSGGGAAPFIGELPFIPGWEFSGEVIASGPDVTGYESGDRVFGFIRFPNRAGCYSQEIAAPADQISKLPSACDPVEAAGLPLAGLTAWQALFNKGGLKPKQRVLVLAAAGGVGHLAVQLAKWKGAIVTGTASPANHDFLKQLGCDHVIDYKNTALINALKDIDLIIDGVGGDTAIEALGCLKQGGVMVTLPSVTKDEVISAGESLGHTVLPIRAEPSSKELSELAELLATKTLKLSVAATYPIENTAQAFEDVASGHTRGKVILTIS